MGREGDECSSLNREVNRETITCVHFVPPRLTPIAAMAHVLPTQIDLAAILTQPNPQIDLRLSVYEASTRNFLKAVSNYSNRALAEITKRKERQAAERKKLSEKTTAVESEINQCKVKEIELVAGEFSRPRRGGQH